MTFERTFSRLTGAGRLVLITLFALTLQVFPPVVSAGETTSSQQLYDLHQALSLEVGRKLRAIGRDYDGQVEKAPAIIVVPLIDKAMFHMELARTNAPDPASGEILEFNIQRLKQLKKLITSGQGLKPPKGSCQGKDDWIDA